MGGSHEDLASLGVFERVLASRAPSLAGLALQPRYAVVSRCETRALPAQFTVPLERGASRT